MASTAEILGAEGFLASGVAVLLLIISPVLPLLLYQHQNLHLNQSLFQGQRSSNLRNLTDTAKIVSLHLVLVPVFLHLPLPLPTLRPAAADSLFPKPNPRNGF